MKSSAYLSETLTDPKTALSQEPNDTSFQKAHNITTSRWAYLDRPENALIARRYAAAMSGSARLQPPEAIVAGKKTFVLLRNMYSVSAVQVMIGVQYLKAGFLSTLVAISEALFVKL